MGASTCVACGECVQACPTGALMPATMIGSQAVDREVESVCPFCSVGCLITYKVRGEKIVGVDGSEPGFEACRQAAALAAPDATMEAVTVVNLAEAVHTGFVAPRVAEQLQRQAEDALGRAAAILGDRARPRLVNGVPGEALMHELARFESSTAWVQVGPSGRMLKVR
jgi:ferredoxin